MLSDRIEYAIKVLDMVQGSDVKREVEDLVVVRQRLLELRPELSELNNDNPVTPEQRWNRDVLQVLEFLFEDGSMYCKDNRNGGFYIARNPAKIAEELVQSGIYWASQAHVQEAQSRLKGTKKG